MARRSRCFTAHRCRPRRRERRIRNGLKELGYVEGQSLTFDVRAAKGDPTRLPALAEELVSQRPDLLYCVAGPDAQACQKATSTIPIVFTQAGDRAWEVCEPS